MTRIRVGLGEATTPMPWGTRAQPWSPTGGSRFRWAVAVTVRGVGLDEVADQRVSRDESEGGREARGSGSVRLVGRVDGAGRAPRPGRRVRAATRCARAWCGEWAMMWRGLTRGGGASDGDALVELRRTGQRLPPAGLFEAILRQRRDWVIGGVRWSATR